MAADGITAAPATGNRRGAATRRRILDAADACFERDGLDLTLDQVAREAGTTRMTVHRHTGGREALVRQVTLRAFGGVVAEVAVVLDGDGPFAERLPAAMAEAVRRIRSTPHLLALLAPSNTSGWWDVDPDERVLGDVRTFVRPYFDQAAARGELREDAARSVEWVMHQLLLYLALPHVADDALVADELRRFVGPALVVD
ncbi:MAG: TetR/AcrR family transcriptional regulator [Actinobacteria bacterium]|nr:TetR/AcrR family transcriptional regulator [Actinomycetota bacterium]